MNILRTHGTVIFILGILGLGIFGCQQRPAVPTVAIQPTEPVIVVVVTATSQPTLAPTKTAEATITPMPTPTVQVTETVTATFITATPPPTRVVAPPTTEPPTAEPVAQPTEPAAPAAFGAPQGISPEATSFRDGDTLRFTFSSVGPLASDQCYRLEMTLGNPNGPGGVGDYWVGLCGDQSAAGSALRFDVKPARFRDEPNYGTLLVSADSVIPPTPEYVMNWTVSVVKLLDTADPVHPQVEAISPASAPLQNTFFR